MQPGGLSKCGNDVTHTCDTHGVEGEHLDLLGGAHDVLNDDVRIGATRSLLYYLHWLLTKDIGRGDETNYAIGRLRNEEEPHTASHHQAVCGVDRCHRADRYCFFLLEV